MIKSQLIITTNFKQRKLNVNNLNKIQAHNIVCLNVICFIFDWNSHFHFILLHKNWIYFFENFCTILFIMLLWKLLFLEIVRNIIFDESFFWWNICWIIFNENMTNRSVKNLTKKFDSFIFIYFWEFRSTK